MNEYECSPGHPFTSQSSNVIHNNNKIIQLFVSNVFHSGIASIREQYFEGVKEKLNNTTHFPCPVSVTDNLLSSSDDTNLEALKMEIAELQLERCHWQM